MLTARQWALSLIVAYVQADIETKLDHNVQITMSTGYMARLVARLISPSPSRCSRAVEQAAASEGGRAARIHSQETAEVANESSPHGNLLIALQQEVGRARVSQDAL